MCRHWPQDFTIIFFKPSVSTQSQFESLTARVLEQGVDVATEVKLTQWQDSMSRELEKLEQRLDSEAFETEKKGVADMKIAAIERRVEETRKDAENEKMGMRTLMQR